MIIKLKLFFLSLGVWAFIIQNCFAQNKPPAKNESERQEIIDFSLSGFGDKGKKSWDVAGTSADISDGLIKLSNVTSNFYSENDTVKLTADTGNFNKTGGTLHVENNVVVTISSGGKMTTDSLDWDKTNQTMSTLDKVNITKDNLVAVGQGASGKPNLNQLNLTKNVKVDINPLVESKKPSGSGSDKITIVCDGPMEMDYLKKSAVFNKNVRVDTRDAVIFSDIMEVYFASSDEKDKKEVNPVGSVFMGSQIERIRAWGSVRIVRGENISYSDEAIYVAAENKIILTGRPRLIISSTEDLNKISN
ncbi:MAG: LPS export ABC transporter periplasmic protein LptC [Candidatus Omnitrophota bacterium]|nr:LPS export ABC transporter periplasmic protein LptC [Candidatus Omnitrophota bacterium]